MVNERLKINGMSCAACAFTIEKTVGAITGVSAAKVNFAAETLSLQFEPPCTLEAVIAAIEKAGYGIKNEDDEEKEEAKRLQSIKRRLLFSLLLTLPLMYISMGHMLGLPSPISPENARLFAIVQLLLATPIVLLSHSFFLRGTKALLQRSPNMNSLIAVGVGSTMIYGITAVVLIFLGHEEYVHHLYFESAATILTFMTLGRLLEAISKGKTGQAIKKLIELQPETAIILRDGEEVTVKQNEIVVGDIIVIRSGERLPADGRIIEGGGWLDQSALTGESIPVEKKVGDTVIGASINKNGYFKYEVEKAGEDSTLSQIIRLVEEAQSSKAPISRLADKVAAYFVPTIILIALLSAAIWLILGESFAFAMTIFVSVLVVACPCALGLATPSAMMVGCGRGAELGILIKNTAVLEMTRKIDVVLFDKTGTITHGKPKVTDIQLANGYSRSRLLSLAASAENASEHPLAAAVVEAAKEENLPILSVSNFLYHVGEGIECEADGLKIQIGKSEFCSKSADISELKSEHEKLSEQGKTVIFVVIDGKLGGLIALADTIKSGSETAIKNLKSRGVDVIMLSGDNEKTARAIAHEVAISEVIAEVMPNEKAACIKRLQESGKVVAMVGDGINDSPSLAGADVGIAIGGGTDIAIESADIVLMQDDLRGVYDAFRLSSAVITNIKENLFWAFCYNCVGVLAACGLFYAIAGVLLSPMIAAAAMSFSSVSVVANSLRLRRFKGHGCQTKAENGNCNGNCPLTNFQKTNEKGGEAMKKIVVIDGMSCKHCAARVSDTLNKLATVSKVDVNLKKKTATLVAADIDDATITAAITAAGYTVVEIR